MKKTVLSVVVLMLTVVLINAQESSKNWSVGFGVSAVDVYPVNGDAPQGDYFDEYFNVNDHWNMGLFIDVSKNFTEKLSLGVRTSYAQLSKWGQFNDDVSVATDNLDYIGLDGTINYKVLNTKLTPVVGIGGGYTWIQEGAYNTYSAKNGIDNLVGAGTVNGSLGLVFNLSDNVSIKAQSTYKHSFKEYLTKHLQHSLGLTYKIGPKAPKVKPDSDGDGVPDESDLCPEVSGLAEYAGCADTDGDGTPDSLDKCPDVKGLDNGCPEKVEVVEEEEVVEPVAPVVKAKEIESIIYFDYNSSDLGKNAKQVLDVIVGSFEGRNEINISVDGYADNVGSDSYNKQLSEERAQAVLNYFVSKGIDKGVITTNSYGESNATSSNETKEGRALNRKTKLKITLK